MLEGAFRKVGRCFPSMCKQEEVKGDDKIREAMGTIKVSKLATEGLNEIIVTTSVYFLSSFCTEIRCSKHLDFILKN